MKEEDHLKPKETKTTTKKVEDARIERARVVRAAAIATMVRTPQRQSASTVSLHRTSIIDESDSSSDEGDEEDEGLVVPLASTMTSIPSQITRSLSRDGTHSRSP